VSRTTVQHITKEEAMEPEVIEQVRTYHDKFETMIGDETYVNNSTNFNSFINEDMPDPDDENVYSPNEEPYHCYTLHEIEE
jgi:hypothetical protein